MTGIPVSALYVHVPFCVRRCDYCDFVSSVYTPAAAQPYLSALNQELDIRAAGLSAQTIYVGGGTPTSLNHAQFAYLFNILTRFVNKDRLVEFSVEINPGTLDQEKTGILVEAGVNRVSLGIQSFNEKGLKILGRTYDPDMVGHTVSLLRAAGFANISVDLIYAWPGQTLSEWERDLRQAESLGIEHISCYALSIEPETRLAERLSGKKSACIDQDQARRFFDTTIDVLKSCGFSHYEISNFATFGRECAHNMNYWIGGEYLGVGAGAHSHVNGERSGNVDKIEEYIKKISENGSAKNFSEKLPLRAKARECAVIWLRLVKGINKEDFFKRTGIELPDLYADTLPELLEHEWLAWDCEQMHLALTGKALPVADAVLSDMV